MDRVEEALKDKKEEIDKITAPEEMEQLLKQALKGRRRRIGLRPIVAVIIAVLFFTYNFDSLAYYGKKFIGYDHITFGALSRLNEEGRGQRIGKTCIFSNGVEVTIDGIMFDDNALVVFYKVHYGGGKLEDELMGNLPRLHIKGLKPMGYYSMDGHGIMIDDHNLTFIENMEPPGFFEKWLEIEIRLNTGHEMEARSIRFTLDRNRAMEKTAGLKLNAWAVLGDYMIVFDEISASSMSSQINGRIIPQTDDAVRAFMPGDVASSLQIPHLEYDIFTDAGQVNMSSGGHSVSGGRITFRGRGDALPEGFGTIQIRNIRMESMELVDKTVELSIDTKGLQVSEDLIINSVYQDGPDLCISASSKGIPVMGLFSGGEQLGQDNLAEFEREAESAEPVERVYRFSPGDGADQDSLSTERLELQVKGIRYTRYSPDVIDVPIE